MSDPALCDAIKDYIAADPSIAEKICFEIVETSAISNLKDAVEFITGLKALGCEFALGDFGSGFASLAYLKSLPVDYLKIDGSFVKGIAEDTVDLAMVRAVNDIGVTMGKRIIAESVESAAVLAQLKALNVEFSQGFAVARPTLIERFSFFAR